MKWICRALCIFAVCFLWAGATSAEDLSSSRAVLEKSDSIRTGMLFDMDLETAQLLPENAFLTLESGEGISSLYLIFDRAYGHLTLTDGTGQEAVVDTQGFLHAFFPLETLFESCPKRLTVTFSDGEAQLNELRIFSPGAVPEWVQQWQMIPDGEADLLLFSTHGDDEQLFFAGLLPWYAGEKGFRVQVAYFTDHRNMTSHRVHEMLNGLWAVGVRDYPVFGAFPDYYTFDMEDAYRFYAAEGYREDSLLAFVVEQLRRFRPLVAVGHDISGEYGHGMHRLYTDLLRKAIEISANPEVFPNLAEEYGVWDVPKTYLHLYSEHPIVMDWDIPLEAFDGKTAYEVSRDLGFASHVSQQRDFAWYFRGFDRAADVTQYNPCYYGLYRSTVGADVQKQDFFENLGPKNTQLPFTQLPTEPPVIFPEELPEPAPKTAQFTAASNPYTEKFWLLFPAVGTLVLTALTACLHTPRGKEKI